MNFLFLDTVGYESALRLSGHHYARLLVERGHRVFSLSAPVTPFHRLSRSHRASINRRFEAHRSGFTPTPGGVKHYVPHSWIPVRNHWPFDLGFVPALAARSYRRDVLRRLEESAFKPDVISLQNLAFYPLLKEFPSALVQYRMTDKMDAFSDYPANLARIESRVLNEAAILSLTSRQFLAHLTPEQQTRALYAPNGVDIEHFARPRPQPEAFRSFDRPIAIYIGAMRDGFDWDLLAGVVARLRDIQFVLISPDTPRADLLEEPHLMHIPGVPYEDVPAYYQHADVTLIPFEDSPLVAPVNPIKMYESLAAGTPVVCREWEEVKRLEAPIRLAKDAESMATAIRIELEAASPERPEIAEFLREHSWEGNLSALLERIEQIRDRKTQGEA